MGQWSVSRGDTHNMGVYLILAAHPHIACVILVGTEFQWTHDGQEFSGTLSWYKINMFHLGLIMQEY